MRRVNIILDGDEFVCIEDAETHEELTHLGRRVQLEDGLYAIQLAVQDRTYADISIPSSLGPYTHTLGETDPDAPWLTITEADEVTVAIVLQFPPLIQEEESECPMPTSTHPTRRFSGPGKP